MSVRPTFEHTDSFCFALKKNFKMLFKRNFFTKKQRLEVYILCGLCSNLSVNHGGLFLFIEAELHVNDVEIVVWDIRMSKLRNICI
jgi:hypothetical protein